MALTNHTGRLPEPRDHGQMACCARRASRQPPAGFPGRQTPQQLIMTILWNLGSQLEISRPNASLYLGISMRPTTEAESSNTCTYTQRACKYHTESDQEGKTKKAFIFKKTHYSRLAYFSYQFNYMRSGQYFHFNDNMETPAV